MKQADALTARVLSEKREKARRKIEQGNEVSALLDLPAGDAIISACVDNQLSVLDDLSLIDPFSPDIQNHICVMREKVNNAKSVINMLKMALAEGNKEVERTERDARAVTKING